MLGNFPGGGLKISGVKMFDAQFCSKSFRLFSPAYYNDEDLELWRV
jgi:hypothetical protein